MPITSLGTFKTVGELKKALADFPDEMDFGFRGEPVHELLYIDQDYYRGVCFQELSEDHIVYAKTKIEFMSLQTYVSLPAEIKASQFNGNIDETPGVFLHSFYSDPADIGGRRLVEFPAVETINGNFARVEVGDYVVQEPDGTHYYPVKAEIFNKRWTLKYEDATTEANR